MVKMALHRVAYLALGLFTAFSQASVLLTKRDGLTSCLSDAKVPHVTSSSSDWAEEIEPYNLRLNYTPAAVAIPTSITHIKDAVGCGVKNDVRVSAKAGGHSYGSYGFGGEDGHLVIELNRMYEVTLFSNNTAKIQPGARLGHVATELYNQGGRAIAHGSGAGVGIAGHVLHGGYGFASRTHGLTLDCLIGATVVLADGSLVHCSATENEDLFWALRGAGSSFGVVAELEFDTFVAPSQATPFNIELDWTEEEAVDGIKALQDLIDDGAPKELNIQVYIASGGQTIQGVYYGTVSQLKSVLKPMLDTLGTSITEASTMGWLESLEYYADGTLDQTYPYDTHTTNYKSGLMTGLLTKDQRQSFFSKLFANSNNSSARHTWFILFDVIGGSTSAVSKISSSATAYPHRDAVLLYQFSDSGSNGNYPAEGFALIKGFRESITSVMGDDEWGMYANYLDTQLDSETAQQLYWGSNLARLKSIKADLDPTNVFWNPQGVTPAN